MSTIERAGAELFYEVRGDSNDGPQVLVHHALLTNHNFLDTVGLSERLVAAGFRVVLPVSIGHKPSSCPEEQSRYCLAERVADVLAVADAAGAERFAFIGYSMGSWIGSGILATAPERITAAVLGGWDLIYGAPTTGATRELMEVAFPDLIPSLAADPFFAPMLTAQDPGALTKCMLALFDDPLPSLDALVGCGVPTLLFCGTEDPYHANMVVASERFARSLVAVDGDHVGALGNPAFVEPVLDFLQATAITGRRHGMARRSPGASAEPDVGEA
jgi:pimeloyl-ACP methyl ester carboxylesterase